MKEGKRKHRSMKCPSTTTGSDTNTAGIHVTSETKKMKMKMKNTDRNTNPFLSCSTRNPLDTDDDKDDSDDTKEEDEDDDATLWSLVDHISTLATGTSRHETPLSSSSSTLNDTSTYDSLHYIVQYLQQQQQQQQLVMASSITEHNNNNHHHQHRTNIRRIDHVISPTEIVQVVVSWCITHLQQQPPSNVSPNNIVWDALNVSMSTFVSSSFVPPPATTTSSSFRTESTNSDMRPTKNHNVVVSVSKLVSQSTLFKLIPKMIQWMTLKNTNNINNNNATTNTTLPDDMNTDTNDALVTSTPILTTYELVLPLFQPTMEVACKHILLPLLQQQQCDDSQFVVRMVLVPTIRWIYKIHTSRKGNPKTTFQLFTDRSILQALSQCDSILQWRHDNHGTNDEIIALRNELMYDIYFHPKHHIEGFMTIFKQKQIESTVIEDQGDGIVTQSTLFKTYHYELLDTIQTQLTLFQLDIDSGNSEAKRKDIIKIIALLPTLFQGFVQQSTIYWNDKKGKDHKRNDATTITKIQYQLFIRWTRPLLSILHSLSNHPPSPAQTDAADVAVVSVLSTIRQMLQNVLDQNIYIPSTTVTNTNVAVNDNRNVGTDAQQYTLLQDIVGTIFHTKPLMKDDDMFMNSTQYEVKQNMIHSLQIIFQLHHVLLQDRMSDTLHLCLHDDPSIRNDNNSQYADIGTDFVVTMISTYRQLRLQRRIFHTVFAVIDELRASAASPSSLNQIQHLIHLFTSRPKIVDAFNQAMINCPIEEMKSIFQICNDWMILVIDDPATGICGIESSHRATRRVRGLGIMIPLLTMITRNVRVESGTAQVIATSCEILASHSIAKLSDTPGDDIGANEMVTVSIILTGLLVQLHMHCVFWLGRGEALTIPKKISDRLELFNTSGSQDINELYESVVFLSCHRLKQLHSMIYEQEVAAMENQVSNEDIMMTLITEAKRTASFIAKRRERSDSTKEYRWIAVAQNVSTWIAYAEKEDIIQFLKWVLSVSSKSMCQNSETTTQELSRSLGFSTQSVDLNSNLEETEVVKCLLADNAFFQYADIDSLLALVGLSLVADLITDALLLSDKSTCDNIELRSFIDTPLTDDAYQRLEPDAIFNPDREYKRVPISKCSKTEAILQQAHNVAMLVVHFPMFSCTDEDIWNFFDLALRLDHVVLSLEFAEVSFLPTLTSISTLARLLLAKVLTISTVSSVQNMFRDYLPFCDLLFGLMDSTRNHISRLPSIDNKHIAQLMESTGSFIDELMAKVQFDSDLAQQLTEAFSRAKQIFIKSSSVPTLVYMSRRILLATKNLTERPAQTLSILFEDMWGVANLSCEMDSKCRPLKYNDDPTVTERPIEPFSLSEGFLLLGDLIDVVQSPKEAALDKLYNKCVRLLQQSMSNDLTILEWSSLCYLTGRIAAKLPSMELTECVLAALEIERHQIYDSQVLEACICQMVSTLSGDNLLSVIVSLTICRSHASARRLRLLRLLLRHVQDLETIELLSSVRQQIFMYALSGLYLKPGDPDWSDTAVAACTLMEDLIKRRDILPLKERDLALILSCMSGALGPVSKESLRGNAVSETEKLSAFTSVSGLFVTIFQRYTKNLYVCAPSVISHVHCMLRHSTYDSLHASKHSMTIRSKHVTQICELLVGHKDIYKKHVIGLVLVFIAGIEQGSLSLQCRDALTPAMYFLLDCMSTFEMQQLNAQMNSKARILFRNVHQNYEKLHTYKGQ